MSKNIVSVVISFCFENYSGTSEIINASNGHSSDEVLGGLESWSKPQTPIFQDLEPLIKTNSFISILPTTVFAEKVPCKHIPRDVFNVQ